MAWPDAELVLMKLLEPLAPTDTALPPEEEWSTGKTVIVINRLPGGGIEKNGVTKHCLMAVLAIAKSRPAAWELSEQIEAALLNDGFPPKVMGVVLKEGTFNVQIDLVEQNDGDNLVVDINPDNRFVETTWWIDFRQLPE